MLLTFRFSSVFKFILLCLRIFLDSLTNLFFYFIYYGDNEKIECVKNPILLETAASLAEKIRKQQIKSVEVINAYIYRIQEIQPILNVVVEDRFQEALEDAKKADELVASNKISQDELKQRFPLLGVPFSVKECLAVKDMHQTTGLYSAKNNIAADDCEVVKLLKMAGGIPLVTTNVPEICTNWETFNNIYGRSRNPYDVRRIVGGSSGGEGGLLGAGGSVIGIGSDLGGSIRIPAFFNGIFGHKPSKRIVSSMGSLPKFIHCYEDFHTLGPMCRFATDLSLMMKVISGNNVSQLNFDRRIDLSKIKIYYMMDDGRDNPLCTTMKKELRQAMKKVLIYFKETLNVKPQKINLTELSHSFNIWYSMMQLVKPIKFSEELKSDYNCKLELINWITGRSQFTLTCILASFYELENIDERFIRMAKKLHGEFKNILQDNVIFLYPSHPETAPYHYETLLKQYNVGYTTIFNILGLPVTQCPLGLSSEDLPLGIQIVGGLYQDHLTISVAEELERAFGGWKNPNLI